MSCHDSTPNKIPIGINYNNVTGKASGLVELSDISIATITPTNGDLTIDGDVSISALKVETISPKNIGDILYIDSIVEFASGITIVSGGLSVDGGLIVDGSAITEFGGVVDATLQSIADKVPLVGVASALLYFTSASNQASSTPIGNTGLGVLSATTSDIALDNLGGTDAGKSIFKLTDPPSDGLILVKSDSTVQIRTTNEVKTDLGFTDMATAVVPLVIASGGTNSTTAPTTSGLIYFDGTRYNANSKVQFDGTRLNVSTINLHDPLAISDGGTNNSATPITSGIFFYDGSKYTTDTGVIFDSTSKVLSATTLNLVNGLAVNQGGTGSKTTPVTSGLIYYDGTSYNSNAAVRFDSTNNTLSATNLKLTNALPITQGGTAATTSNQAITNLGATTVGSSIFVAANPTAVTYLKVNANNSVTFIASNTLRSELQVVPGTDVQAYDATLAAIASQTTASNVLIYFSGVDQAASSLYTSAGRKFVACPDTLAQGDIFYYDGTNFKKLAKPSSIPGVLTFAEGESAPSWTVPDNKIDTFTLKCTAGVISFVNDNPP